jgi:hypothetical protein
MRALQALHRRKALSFISVLLSMIILGIQRTPNIPFTTVIGLQLLIITSSETAFLPGTKVRIWQHSLPLLRPHLQQLHPPALQLRQNLRRLEVSIYAPVRTLPPRTNSLYIFCPSRRESRLILRIAVGRCEPCRFGYIDGSRLRQCGLIGVLIIDFPSELEWEVHKFYGF